MGYYNKYDKRITTEDYADYIPGTGQPDVASRYCNEDGVEVSGIDFSLIGEYPSCEFTPFSSSSFCNVSTSPSGVGGAEKEEASSQGDDEANLADCGKCCVQQQPIRHFADQEAV